jgi:hypothetical protein
MKKFLFLLALLFSVAAIGCGTAPKNLSKNGNGGTDAKDQPEKCPGGAISPSHEIDLHLKEPSPAKLALEIDGKREIDECRELPETPPFVVPEKKAGNEFDFTVIHNGAYPTLPTEISFRLVDLGDCKGAEREVFSAERLALKFESDYPNGIRCPGRVHATLLVFDR